MADVFNTETVQKVAFRLDKDVMEWERQFGQMDRKDVLGLYGSETSLAAKKRELDFLRHIKTVLKPDKILYPGSGFDQIPREVFGSEKCVYTSLRESENYFKKGIAPNIVADYGENPFPPSTFDMIYLHDPPYDTLQKAIPELARVLKEGGIFVLASDSYNITEQENIINAINTSGAFEDITPSGFKKTEFINYSAQEMIVKKEVYDLAVRAGKKSEVNGQRLAILQKRS